MQEALEAKGAAFTQAERAADSFFKKAPKRKKGKDEGGETPAAKAN